MRLIIKEARLAVKSKGPASLQPFIDFVDKFINAHGDFNPRNLDSGDTLIQFAKNNLANNKIVKSGLVNNELITYLQTQGRKTGNWTPASIAAVLISRFNDWVERKDK